VTDDYRAQLKQLLAGVDLDLTPDEKASFEIAEIAQERARTGEPEGLKHKLVAQVAPTEATTTGEFQARVSDTVPDRQSEHFTREGFHRAVQNFRKRGRPLPLLFGHNQTNATNVVGMVINLEVSPQDELIASGVIDTNDHLGQKIHRMLREGALQWSIGGVWSGPRSRDGVRTLDLRELGEISIVPLPANERTRTLSIKADPADLTEDEIRQWAKAAGVLPPKKPMSLGALQVEREQILRDLGLDAESQRERQRLEKKRDYLDMELALGEPLDAEEKRQRENAALRREVDKLRVEAAADFDSELVKGAADVGPHAREKLRALIRYYMTKMHPWTECYRDNVKRFGAEGAKRVCAVLKDIGSGTTHWRKADQLDTHVDRLLEAGGYDADALIAMFHEHMAANDPEALRDLMPARTGERSVKDLMLQLMTGDHE
jgi:Caudovirus prohead serine protease